LKHDWFRLCDSGDLETLKRIGLEQYLDRENPRPKPVTVANFLKTEIWEKTKGGVIPDFVMNMIMDRLFIDQGKLPWFPSA
jgi:hypothetical protein